MHSLLEELHARAHGLDPARLTALRRCGHAADVVDVYSPSIWAGWYGGLYTEYKAASRAEIAKVRHFLHAEWGADSHAGRHAEDGQRGIEKIDPDVATDEQEGDYLLTGGRVRASKDSDWTETYFCDLADWHLKEQETMPELTGSAQWPFKDFATPVRPDNPIPYMNQKGVVERDLTPKEGYYVFQSYWSRQPMVRIYGHSWPIRWGQTGEPKLVRIYSNCPEVELFLDGRSLGRRRRNSQDFPCAGLRWETALPEGAYHLRAVGYAEGTSVEDAITQVYQTQTWGPPAGIRIDALETENGRTRVRCQIVDASGIPCLDAKTILHFSLAGPGRLLDNQGTVRGSRQVQARNGRGDIYLLPAKARGTLAVYADGLPTAFVEIPPDNLCRL